MNVFWFRRDLRLNDNHGLFKALKAGKPVLPLFIFDENIIGQLKPDDKRVLFIYRQLEVINKELEKHGSWLLVLTGKPNEVFENLVNKFKISAVFSNRDYEPYAVDRDKSIKSFLESRGVEFFTFNDQMIFEPGEVVKPDGSLYEVFTPFSKKWLSLYDSRHSSFHNSGNSIDKSIKKDDLKAYNSRTGEFYESELLLDKFIKSHDLVGSLPSLEQIGFKDEKFDFPDVVLPIDKIRDYDKTRDYPALDGTTRVGIHLRFGTISIRECVKTASELNQTWLNELIWREFFMHVLAYFPRVVNTAYKVKYDNINWLNNEDDFARWCNGTTGYPLVDAGMRQMLQTGFMHNRVRMVTASFLAKHLLIDWRWGEAFFAEHLLDYELSSNNGNWQWAAGCGCDAAPYFRIFNPARQQEKFDKHLEYVRKWVLEYGTPGYPEPVVDHEFARERCLEAYRKALNY